jgi:multidrug efflux system membrane fusion protein
MEPQQNGTTPLPNSTSHSELETQGQTSEHQAVKSGKGWIWIIVIALVIVAGVYYFRPKSTAADAGTTAAPAASGRGRSAQGPAAITVGQSHTGDMPIYDNSLGTVTPLNTITLYSQITGKVMSVHYQEGQLVKKGQILVEIDDGPSRATLAQAEGTLKRDTAVLAQAKIDLDRYRTAFSRNAIAKQQLDDQEQIVQQDEGTVQTDQATVDYDKIQLAYCHIASPITGRVGLRLVDPGNTVFAGSSSTLAVITQLQPITVVFNPSEDDLPQIQAQLKGHKTLEVTAFDRSDATALDTGKLTAFDNQIDTTTGTVKFRATFPNSTAQLFPNQFVNAHLLVTTLKDVTLVPTAAVQHNGTQAFVYIVTLNAKPDAKPTDTANTTAAKDPAAAQKPSGPTGKVSAQNITVLSANEKETAVTGIGANVTLATSGFDRLEPGATAQIRSSGSHSGSGAPASDKAAAPADKPKGHAAK